ncbi:MAG: M15 family metallopeptidase [Clostridia bacterium]|nr:M15 family metallopeptidase [Clostridia bacterium]
MATVDAYGRILGISPGTCTVTVAAGARPELTAEIPVTVYAASYASEVTYIEGILVANKTYGLPPSYDPGVDPDAKAALDELIAAAAEDDINLWLKSGYRAFETQKMLYNTYVSREGKLEADRYSARPGHSEHQTGLAFDLNSLEQNFGETKEGIWLAEHCVEYGFIIRYPADKEEITGYMYEPWHIRYLGKETARLVSESGKCLEEYLGIISQYEY